MRISFHTHTHTFGRIQTDVDRRRERRGDGGERRGEEKRGEGKKRE